MIIVFLGFAAVSGIALQSYSKYRGTNGGGIYDGGNTFSLDTNTIVLFVFVIGMAFVLSFAYIWLARLFPKAFIWVTGILNIIFAIGTAIYYFIVKYYSAAIVFLIFGCFLAFCFYTWISRIPFSALMLKTSIDVSKKYGHVYLVSLIGGLIAAAFSAWFSITLVAVYTKWEPSDNNPACRDGSCGKGTVIGLIVFITFAMYWISEWLKNTIHTIIAGVYGSWYFCVHNFPKDATRGAARRALTYSFGSISFGSLVVAILQFLRQLCSVARSQAGNEGGVGGMVGYVVFCILGCLLSIIEWAVEFLNRYAFIHIALYGKAYIAAAKDTWKMIKDRGIDALINVSSPSPNSRLHFAADNMIGLSHRARAVFRRPFHRVCMCTTRLPLPPLHRPRVQPRWRLHARRHGLLLPHRLPNLQYLHHPHFERHRNDLCRGWLGSRGHGPRPPGALPRDGPGVPPSAAGYPGAVVDYTEWLGKKLITRDGRTLILCEAHAHEAEDQHRHPGMTSHYL